jgi:hypothetical protein
MTWERSVVFVNWFLHFRSMQFVGFTEFVRWNDFVFVWLPFCIPYYWVCLFVCLFVLWCLTQLPTKWRNQFTKCNRRRQRNKRKISNKILPKIYSLDFFTFPYFNVLSKSPTLSILYKKQSRCDPQFNNWFIMRLLGKDGSSSHHTAPWLYTFLCCVLWSIVRVFVFLFRTLVLSVLFCRLTWLIKGARRASGIHFIIYAQIQKIGKDSKTYRSDGYEPEIMYEL